MSVHASLLGRCRGGGKVTAICLCQENGAGGLGGIWKIIRELGDQDVLWMENWVLFSFCFNRRVEWSWIWSVLFILWEVLGDKMPWEGLHHVLSSVLPEVVIRAMEVEVLSSSQLCVRSVSVVHVLCGGLRRLATHQPLPLLCANIWLSDPSFGGKWTQASRWIMFCARQSCYSICISWSLVWGGQVT